MALKIKYYKLLLTWLVETNLFSSKIMIKEAFAFTVLWDWYLFYFRMNWVRYNGDDLQI